MCPGTPPSRTLTLLELRLLRIDHLLESQAVALEPERVSVPGGAWHVFGELRRGHGGRRRDDVCLPRACRVGAKAYEAAFWLKSSAAY